MTQLWGKVIRANVNITSIAARLIIIFGLSEVFGFIHIPNTDSSWQQDAIQFNLCIPVHIIEKYTRIYIAHCIRMQATSVVVV